MDNKEKYLEIFTTTLGISKEDTSPDYTFKENVKWDSMVHLTLISNLEVEFGIMLESEDILNFGSYKNGYEILKKHGII